MHIFISTYRYNSCKAKPKVKVKITIPSLSFCMSSFHVIGRGVDLTPEIFFVFVGSALVFSLDFAYFTFRFHFFCFFVFFVFN